MQTKQSTLDPSNSTRNDASTDTPAETTLQLTYKNTAGNAIVRRQYVNHGAFVREIDQEYMYNYVENRWESVHRFVHDYELSDDGETLAGDGSNWRGTGRQWESWFTDRHYERLLIRFPADEIPEDPVDHDPVDLPSGIPEE